MAVLPRSSVMSPLRGSVFVLTAWATGFRDAPELCSRDQSSRQADGGRCSSSIAFALPFGAYAFQAPPGNFLSVMWRCSANLKWGRHLRSNQARRWLASCDETASPRAIGIKDDREPFRLGPP